jgi:hypothetical protein
MTDNLTPDQQLDADFYHHGPEAFRDHAINKAVAKVCTWVSPGDAPDLVAAVVAEIEPVVRRIAADEAFDIAQGEAAEHSPGCHGFYTAQRLSFAISLGRGVDEIASDRLPCPPRRPEQCPHQQFTDNVFTLLIGLSPVLLIAVIALLVKGA